MNKAKLFILLLMLSAFTWLNAVMWLGEVNGIVDIDSSENKVIYVASKDRKDYLAITDEVGSLNQIISPSYTIKQEDCESADKLFDSAAILATSGNYKRALDLYRKGYSLCPIKDVEEMMAWLMGEVGNE